MNRKYEPGSSGHVPALETCAAVGNAKQPEAGLLLLLARVCSFMESTALVHVMETLAATFPGQGGGSGSGQPPAFVAGEVARLATDSCTLSYYWGQSALTHLICCPHVMHLHGA